MDGSHLLLFIIILGLAMKINSLREQCDHWRESCNIYMAELARTYSHVNHLEGKGMVDKIDTMSKEFKA